MMFLVYSQQEDDPASNVQFILSHERHLATSSNCCGAQSHQSKILKVQNSLKYQIQLLVFIFLYYDHSRMPQLLSFCIIWAICPRLLCDGKSSSPNSLQYFYTGTFYTVPNMGVLISLQLRIKNIYLSFGLNLCVALNIKGLLEFLYNHNR